MLHRAATTRRAPALSSACTRLWLFTAPRVSPAAVRHADSTASWQRDQSCFAKFAEVTKRASPFGPDGRISAPLPPLAQPCPQKWNTLARGALAASQSTVASRSNTACENRAATCAASRSADASTARAGPPGAAPAGADTINTDDPDPIGSAGAVAG